MADDLLSLDSIGLKCQTDKSSKHHNYLAFYERFFAPRRHEALTILEVGVFRGASLAVWEEYFPNARIVGADINFAAKRFERPRVAIEIVDQSNIEDLARLAARHGPFDIVVEDGSHLWDHQITTLRTLFPFVRGGGFYIAEDLQTNYGKLTANYRGVASISCVEYLKRWLDLRVGDDQIDIAGEEDAFLRTYGRGIEFLTFYRRCCLIEKSIVRHGRARTSDQAPILPQRAGDLSGYVAFVVHVGQIGDLLCPSASFAATMPGQNIQGFTLLPMPPLQADLSCRARLHDGTWTDWIASHTFVGTQRVSRDLTGLAVRLTGPDREAYSLMVMGMFRGENDPVVAGDGEPCVARSGLAPLHGMQIVLRKAGAP